MSVSYYQLAVEGNLRALNNLSHLLDKASDYVQANKLEERALLDARLFPDMWPLIRQIRMVCFMSCLAPALLAGKEPLKFDDNETSFAELKARIDKAIAFLKTFSENDFAESAEREIRLPWSPAPYRGESFLLQNAVPNIYFHMTTAYALLRHNGVSIGKSDYLGKIC
ncbi:MAG: DUF1993 domain-containing protein [Azoarcus sp.]|jgi:hypothetical protein|nr:DUF1993 domain-containing protein [Azoarcus sp.]